MHRVHLTYTLHGREDAQRDLHHPLMAMLAAVHDTGSISGAARRLSLSYRHVWGELKRWELELGQTLVLWAKGQPAALSPFGEKLLWAERRAQARLAPQIEALRSELEQAFAIAFDDSAGVIPIVGQPRRCAAAAAPAGAAAAQAAPGHPLQRQRRRAGGAERGPLPAGGLPRPDRRAARSPTARAYRPMLKPGQHKLVGFARRTQGLMVAPGNPLGVRRWPTCCGPACASRPATPAPARASCSTNCWRALHIDPARIEALTRTEPSHRAAAEAVASGSADVSFGIEAAARARGLDFLPLAHEHYFLVALRAALEHPQVQTLLELLRSPAWQQQLNALPGYAADRSGEVLSLNRVLPWWSYRKPKP